MNDTHLEPNLTFIKANYGNKTKYISILLHWKHLGYHWQTIIENLYLKILNTI